MNAVKVLFAVLIFGSLKEASSYGYNSDWGRTVGDVWRDWREQPVYVKRCSLYETLGFCPSDDRTICILEHGPLVTGKLCGHCSSTIWFAYKLGSCPGDVLRELAEETGNHYYRNHHHHRHESRHESEREKERRHIEHREKQLEQELEFPAGETFESGSGEMNEEPTETSFTPYSTETQIEPNENSEGIQSSQESDLIDMDLLDRFPRKEEKKRESIFDKLKAMLNDVGDIFS